jgi:TatD DNase family protein
MLTDAHNHLHDSSLIACRQQVLAECEAAGMVGAVVNGTRFADWGAVLDLAAARPWIVPSVGFHPWFLGELPEGWRGDLERTLKATRCCVGEIGMDLRDGGSERALQEAVFRGQIEVAKAHQVPFTVHGGRSWGLIHDIMRMLAPYPAGFLLHSFSGSSELMRSFVDMGGYISCSGAFLLPNRDRALKLFRDAPIERVLVESDSPFQPPPRDCDHHHLKDPSTGERLSHPLVVRAIGRRLAEARGISEEEYSQVLARNFERLFGALRRKAD